jgi:hypothetical protein
MKYLHKMRLLHTIIRGSQCTEVMLATVGHAKLRANADNSIAIDQICDNTKEMVSGFAK